MVDEKKITALKRKQAQLAKKLGLRLSLMLEQQNKELSKAKSLAQLQAIAGTNIFMKSINKETLAEFMQGIDQAFKTGITYAPGTNSRDAIGFSEMVQQNVGNFVSKLGEDIRVEALDIIDKGIADAKLTYDISNELQDRLQIKKSRADAIARTEVMRSSNAGSFVQAQQDGATYFVVDNRAEACEECQDTYEGEVFSIDDVDVLPPLHPNCACVPVYFNDSNEAQDWASSIQSEDTKIRETIVEETGKPIPTDGTGNVSNN